MKKVVIFDKTSKWWHETPNVELLNKQITEIEKDGWRVISINSNTNLFGTITSFTLLLESQP